MNHTIVNQYLNERHYRKYRKIKNCLKFITLIPSRNENLNATVKTILYDVILIVLMFAMAKQWQNFDNLEGALSRKIDPN